MMILSSTFMSALAQFAINLGPAIPIGGSIGGISALWQDPCAAIAGQNWSAPSDVRACITSFRVNETVKANIIEVINKTLAFHTSVNYQIEAPEPFASYVHEDVLRDLQRISRKRYESDYDLHVDLSRSFKRLNDGHCVWINFCYDALYVNYIPTPVVLLTWPDGSQHIHIAPEAFEIASAEFPDQIDVWQDALPDHLKGKLASLSGAEVLLINKEDPWIAVHKNALITGGYQGYGTRQNSFFSSYQRGARGWNYMMGNFAQQSLPLDDFVDLTIRLANGSKTETIRLPYRSRFSSASVPFTDSASYRANNCKATNGTNGFDIYADTMSTFDISMSSLARAQQLPQISDHHSRKQPMNIFLDSVPFTDVALPARLQPIAPANESYQVAQFYMLDDRVTGVLVLGSFVAGNYSSFLRSLMSGLTSLKSSGATRLIVDVTNNGGGYICAAHYLHRIIVGPKDSTIPQAGLDTTARVNPLAQEIVKQIVEANVDPEAQLLYHPTAWSNASHIPFGNGTNWLYPTVEVRINGREDTFSQRLGAECPESSYPVPPPAEALFDPKRVVIISNGRCASSCSLFSITMSKEDGAKIVVVGGKDGVGQQYCGTVGGQSTGFWTIDTEVKSTKLKKHELAPPDLLVNGVQGITWRLGYGIENPNEPEEWQDHPADHNWPLTAATVNNPTALWKEIAAELLPLNPT